MVSIGVCGAAELAQAVPETFLGSNSLHTRVCCAHSHVILAGRDCTLPT